MNTKNLPFKLLSIVAILFALGAMCGGATLPLSNVARDYSPQSRVEANATATAAPVALAPTRTYQERVMPTLQAVEAQEIVATTERRYENARAASTAWLWLRIGAGLVALAGVAVYVGCASVERAKRAVEYEPFQVLPDKPLYFPRRVLIAHTSTMASISLLTEHTADVDHGTLLIDSGASARYRITPGRGRRVSLPVVVEGVCSAE